VKKAEGLVVAPKEAFHCAPTLFSLQIKLFHCAMECAIRRRSWHHSVELCHRHDDNVPTGARDRALTLEELVTRTCELACEVLRHPDSAYTTDELAQFAGLTRQRASFALVALEVVGRATRRYDPELRRQVWLGQETDRASTVKSPLRTFYSVSQAARVSGRTEKALRRRMERGTLPVVREGRHVYLTHAALQVAGLVDQRPKRTWTGNAISAFADAMRQTATSYIGYRSLPSTVFAPSNCLVILAAWSAAGLVEARAGGLAWRWRGA
jgi:hypothetical protein